MAGLIGSLAMLLEARQAGARVDLQRIPVPDGVTMGRWLISFPAYAFLLTIEPSQEEECVRAFTDRGLTCVSIGEVEPTGILRLVDGSASENVVDFSTDQLTGITPI